MKCILCNILTAGLLGLLVGTGCSSGYKVGDCVYNNVLKTDLKIIKDLGNNVFVEVDRLGIMYTFIPDLEKGSTKERNFKISCDRFDGVK